ncbi:putative cytochrome P450 monooxygenase [Xylariaceae sp. AK1471]|nr:putative cytochrome P450 monooxygenase [Xylariaceae sp. AK1471]
MAATIHRQLTPIVEFGTYSYHPPDISQLIDAFYGQTSKSLQELHRRYGDTVRLGPNTVSLSDPSMIAAVYGIRASLPKSYHWRVWQSELNGKVVPSVLYTQESKAHGTLKRPIASVFSLSNISKLEPLCNRSIVAFVKKLDEHFIAGSGGDNSVPMHSWVHYFGYDSVMNMTLSRDFGFIERGGDVEGVFSGLDMALTYRASVFTMPWIHSLVAGSPLKQVFAKRIAKFQQRARALVQSRMAQGTLDSSRPDLLLQLLDAQKAHPDVVNDLVLNGYVVLPVLAGADTVAIVLGTIVYYMAKNPKVTAKLHAELQALNLKLPPKFADVRDLPYLGAVIREGLRIHPISAFISRRTVSPGDGLLLPNGRRLPPGTIVAVSPWVTHFDECVYGSDAREFNPDRWLQAHDETTERYEERLRDMNRADLSWGHGDRVCIGKNIARFEIYKLIATLYTLFDIEPVDSDKEWEVKETLLTKQAGINVKLSWRPGFNSDVFAEAEL